VQHLCKSILLVSFCGLVGVVTLIEVRLWLAEIGGAAVAADGAQVQRLSDHMPCACLTVLPLFLTPILPVPFPQDSRLLSVVNIKISAYAALSLLLPSVEVL